MIISCSTVFLLLVFFQDIGLGISATDVCNHVQDGVTTISHTSFDTLVDTAGNNSIINIANITLSSNEVLKYFENITIIGDSINCNSTGSVKFVSCKNVSIRSIRWRKCGTSTNPAIGFYNSSNVVLCNCSFHHSTGKAVTLSKVSGNVSINNCQFTHNNQYEGHGTALHLSQSENHVQLNVTINNCNFSSNGPAESVVYLNGTPNYNNLIIQNSEFTQNQGVPIYISHTSLILNNIVSFKDNKATAIYASQSDILFHGSSDVIFYMNSAQEAIAIFWSHITFNGEGISVLFDENFGAAIYGFNSTITFNGSGSVNFTNSRYPNGTILTQNSHIRFDGTTSVRLANNQAGPLAGTITLRRSNITFSGNTSVTFENNTATESGGAIYGDHSAIITNGNASIIFVNNGVTTMGNYGRGGGISIIRSCIIFNGSSSIRFDKNYAYSGGAISGSDASVICDGNTQVNFSNNNASWSGGAIGVISSSIIFNGSSWIRFDGNNACDKGGAIDATKSIVHFTGGNSSVTFDSNRANNVGGAINLLDTTITVNGNMSIRFVRNSAGDRGGGIYQKSSNTKFDGNLLVMFDENSATNDGGAIYGVGHSVIEFDKDTKVHFDRNIASNGAAMYISTSSNVILNGSSMVEYNFNTAVVGGGAVYSTTNSTITLKGGTRTLFSNNSAGQDGAAIYSIIESIIRFDGSSYVTFESNLAKQHGGALYSFRGSSVTFEGNSNIKFYNNTAVEIGGAIHSTRLSTIFFKGSSRVVFANNIADMGGGAIASRYGGFIYFENSSTLNFTSNKCTFSGGAIYLFHNITASLSQSTNITLYNNTARKGGAMYCYGHCNVTIEGSSNVSFNDNSVVYSGGGVYCGHYSVVTLKGSSSVTFTKNSAKYGGAVLIAHTNMTITDNSIVHFSHNNAYTSGGAMYLSIKFDLSLEGSSNVTYSSNNADRYGGALYADLNMQNITSRITVDTNMISFSNNSASNGPDMYIDIPLLCNETYLNDVITNSSTMNFNQLSKHIRTPPTKLSLGYPANYTSYNSYTIKDIMLGQEIVLNATLVDNYNHSVNATLFVVNIDDHGYSIDGPIVVPISNDIGFQGIRIKGAQLDIETVKVTLTIRSYTDSQSDLKRFSINLISELSPCHRHPGFYYSNTSERCICYDKTDTVSCSDDQTSTIKRGYWFGSKPGSCNGSSCTPTVSICPNNYCNFTCCEDTNGYYQLSPQRENQCSSHRNGTACGSCEGGYTLSFDSVECVSINKCTTGQTVLVVTLSMIYWIVIVILVFIMTYYHVGIGYLYAITYYYSMLDILLSQNLYFFQELFIAVSTISSIAKITPQFLGEYCLVRNMTGIGQQFIHYVHPLAVTIIIALICLLARISRRFTAFISRGIIRTVCFLLLLSYTSVATTSLLLLRSLTFDNVDKVYTYLSPDIEYCHGRHLPYFIVAVLCTLVIVIGLPLLLLLEPFLNHKINFTRMKPLLDQFQGCYKDKYRCFAAYYMICRLVIIVIIIANPSSNITTQFLLAVAVIILASIQLIVRPYASSILNLFDGFVLQIMSLQLVALSLLIDNDDQKLLVLTVVIILMTLPLVVFVVMELFINRNAIKRVSMYVRRKPNSPIAHDHCEYALMDKSGAPMELQRNRHKGYAYCQESFIEVMDDIKD